MATVTEEMVPVSTTPVELLRIAVSNGADIATLERLIELRERVERNEARKAFVVAMNAFKKNPPEIVRNRNGEHGKYSTLDVVCKAVMGALSEQGISHRWEYEQTLPDWITVTCVLTHEAGHSERTTMGGPSDAAGPKGNVTKNGIQALASTRTYLERYTLLGAIGLESAQDNDGKSATTTNAALLSEDKIKEQVEWIGNARNLDELQRLYKAAYKEADAAGDKSAQKRYIRAKDDRKAELQ